MARCQIPPNKSAAASQREDFVTLAELLIISGTPAKSANSWNNRVRVPHFYPSIFSAATPPANPPEDRHSSVRLCLYDAYHGRCWGTWDELRHSPPWLLLWCPPGTPAVVSRLPLLLSWGSHSGWRGMETLHVHQAHINSHEIWTASLLQKLHECIRQVLLGEGGGFPEDLFLLVF